MFVVAFMPPPVANILQGAPASFSSARGEIAAPLLCCSAREPPRPPAKSASSPPPEKAQPRTRGTPVRPRPSGTAVR